MLLGLFVLVAVAEGALVIVGVGAGLRKVPDEDVVMVLSRHPNQPGVWHVVVEAASEVVVGTLLVVVSSRQPHQPNSH